MYTMAWCKMQIFGLQPLQSGHTVYMKILRMKKVYLSLKTVWCTLPLIKKSTFMLPNICKQVIINLNS